MAPNELHGSVLACRVEAIVIGHDLLPLRVGKHLVPAEPVAERKTHLLATFAAHRVEAVVSSVVLNLWRHTTLFHFIEQAFTTKSESSTHGACQEVGKCTQKPGREFVTWKKKSISRKASYK